MEIRNSLDAVRSLLGVEGASQSAQSSKKTSVEASNVNLGFGADQATLSNAGSEVSSSSIDGEIRYDKVAAIQAALASGSYEVPASAVATKLVDSMLGKGI